ncbi:uncharacterized protein JN550_012807 [Neoarthrinium moseri]|nr:uncharacterized protein JN550_012807 [Neoarthrinium moseri]KAI1858276.1 hypothetical protein JN550_012807 [Neoarthrinium moseri]
MPDKITSKNLSYDQSLPPFLARLRGQQTSDAHTPDPILAAHRRPGRVRSASEEAEDEPVVVDEEGNVVVLRPDQLDSTEARDGDETVASSKDSDQLTDQVVDKESEKVAVIGAARKRKIGRVIGGSEEKERSSGVDADIAKAVEATKALSRDNPKEDTDRPAKSTKKGSKRAKKIKLSFGDDEG